MEFLCEMHEAQVARGRYFVHELTSEVDSRMKCVMKIMAMPGTRMTVADLCMSGLAACDEGGSGFVKASAGMDGHQRETTQSREGNKQERGYVKLPEQWRNRSC